MVKLVMLKKESRLLKRKDFGEIREKGKMVWGQMMGMSYITPPTRQGGSPPLDKGGQKNRFGVVVSKKISNLAVVRNRIRRQIYGGIKNNMKNLEDKGYKIIFLVKKSVVARKNKEIEKEVKLLLGRLF